MNNLYKLTSEIADLEIKRNKVKVSHVAHLILTLLTGFWVIIWAVCAVSAASERKEIENKIIRLKVDRDMEMMNHGR